MNHHFDGYLLTRMGNMTRVRRQLDKNNVKFLEITAFHRLYLNEQIHKFSVTEKIGEK